MMSIQFDQPMNKETQNLIEKLFGDKVVAYDDQNIILERINQFNQSEFKALANEAGQPVTLELHDQDDIVEMKDGTRYRVTEHGWKKI